MDRSEPRSNRSSTMPSPSVGPDSIHGRSPRTSSQPSPAIRSSTPMNAYRPLGWTAPPLSEWGIQLILALILSSCFIAFHSKDSIGEYMNPPSPTVMYFDPELLSDPSVSALHFGRTSQELNLYDAKVKVAVFTSKEEIERAQIWSDRSNHPSLVGILIANPKIADRENEAVLLSVLQYAENGGTVVFSGPKFHEMKASNLDQFFSEVLGLPWQRAEMPGKVLHEAVINLYAKARFCDLPQQRLGPHYTMGSTFAVQSYVTLRNVAPEDALYTVRFEDPSLTPVAFTSYGKGHVAFVGILNMEPKDGFRKISSDYVYNRGLYPVIFRDPEPAKQGVSKLKLKKAEASWWGLLKRALGKLLNKDRR